MLRGRIAIDFRDGPVELGEGDFIVVPRGVEHRPRSLTREPVVLMFEPATTLNTGNARSDLTVTDSEAAVSHERVALLLPIGRPPTPAGAGRRVARRGRSRGHAMDRCRHGDCGRSGRG
ncbi:cupin domain-containing protein [Mesorhizobium atlanticum]